MVRFGSDIARREHRHQDRDLGKALDEAVGEHVVALELRVAPDLRFLAEQLFQPDLQGRMQAGDPPLLSLGQRLVVDMGVADEDVVLEFH